MNFFKKIGRFFAYPPLWLLIALLVIAVLSMAASTIILTQDFLSDYILAGYILLGVMGLTLAYAIYGIVKTFPTIKEKAITWAERHPKLGKIITDSGIRSTVMTAITFVINIAFVVYNGSIAIVIRSIWFGALAAYNLVLVIFKAVVLIYKKRRSIRRKNGQTDIEIHIDDTKRYRIYGVLLTLLPVCLSFAILQMVRAGDSFEHTGITIYVYAIYAFYRIIASTIDLFKSRKHKDMIFRALKNLSLAAALLSILALQTAMFKEFGTGMSGINIATMNAITGAAVCLLTFTIGIYMIIEANVRIKKIKQNEMSSDNQSDESDVENDA